MQDRQYLDLQREADEDSLSTSQSEEEAERLDAFKEGKLDRWGQPVDGLTRTRDFYKERTGPDEPR
jgi:hypothetical protein